jgi:hypothetical protein
LNHLIFHRASLIKNSFLITLLLLNFGAFSQFSEDFLDGDFTANPTWSGEVSKFAVTNGELELKDAGATGNAYLLTASSVSQNAVWEFYHRYESNPSTSNRAEVYLMSDQSDLSGPLNGYYLRIGEQTGTTDKIVLFKRNGANSTEILTTSDGSALNAATEVNVRIRVTRDNLGNWEVFADKEGGTDFISLGSVNDNTYNFSLFMGVQVKYSSTRNEGYYFFDDFVVTGEGVVDETAPELLQVNVLSANSLLLEFSEAMDPNTVDDISAYSVNNGVGMPNNVEIVSADEYILTFPNDFQSGIENTLTVSSVADLSGNILEEAFENFTYFEVSAAEFNDVIITEIHPAPQDFTPVPNVEFLEIFNRSDKAFQLQNWTLQDASISGIVSFPAIILAPNSYTIVCNEQFVDLFSSFGSVIGVDGLPTLNDSGDDLILRDENGQLIFHITYSSTWYGDNIKADGGWSLEMKDTELPCLGQVNWSASNDVSGGTPGRENSINTSLSDETAIQLVDVEVIDASNISAVLSEKIDLTNLDNLTFSINNGIGLVTDFTIEEPQLLRVNLVLSSPIAENTIYTLTVTNLFDCANNAIGSSNSFDFGLPLMVEFGDLVINEILFNPFTDQVDFVEVYNKSDKLLSTKDLIIGEADPFITDSVIDFANLSTTKKLIFPRDYIVFTEDADLVKQAYFTPSPNKFLTVPGIPNYPDDEGVVQLLRSDLLLLDQIIYTDEWHFGLIDDQNGVSLERIDVNATTQDQNNWHSAASSVGFATPGYNNSVLTELESGNEVSIQPEVFTPNGDGLDDFTLINYNFSQSGYVVNVTIFDAKGRLINQLVRNETPGLQGFYKWDGLTDEGEKARSGLYIILVDLFDLNGNRKKLKKEVAIGL